MKDSIAGAVSTFGAGVAQIAHNPEILTPEDPMHTAVGATISLVVGVISMLLNRLANKWFKKKTK